MRLTCPRCQTQYEVSAASIPAEGRDVQCGSCQETWFQLPMAPAALALGPELQVKPDETPEVAAAPEEASETSDAAELDAPQDAGIAAQTSDATIEETAQTPIEDTVAKVEADLAPENLVDETLPTGMSDDRGTFDTSTSDTGTSDTGISNDIVTETVNQPEADLGGLDVSAPDLEVADALTDIAELDDAKLDDTQIVDADLEEISLSDATLGDPALDDSALDDTPLDDTALEDVKAALSEAALSPEFQAPEPDADASESDQAETDKAETDLVAHLMGSDDVDEDEAAIEALLEGRTALDGSPEAPAAQDASPEPAAPEPAADEPADKEPAINGKTAFAAGAAALVGGAAAATASSKSTVGDFVGSMAAIDAITTIPKDLIGMSSKTPAPEPEVEVEVEVEEPELQEPEVETAEVEVAELEVAEIPEPEVTQTPMQVAAPEPEITTDVASTAIDSPLDAPISALDGLANAGAREDAFDEELDAPIPVARQNTTLSELAADIQEASIDVEPPAVAPSEATSVAPADAIAPAVANAIPAAEKAKIAGLARELGEDTLGAAVDRSGFDQIANQIEAKVADLAQQSQSGAPAAQGARADALTTEVEVETPAEVEPNYEPAKISDGTGRLDAASFEAEVDTPAGRYNDTLAAIRNSLETTRPGAQAVQTMAPAAAAAAALSGLTKAEGATENTAANTAAPEALETKAHEMEAPLMDLSAPQATPDVTASTAPPAIEAPIMDIPAVMPEVRHEATLDDTLVDGAVEGAIPELGTQNPMDAIRAALAETKDDAAAVVPEPFETDPLALGSLDAGSSEIGPVETAPVDTDEVETDEDGLGSNIGARIVTAAAGASAAAAAVVAMPRPEVEPDVDTTTPNATGASQGTLADRLKARVAEAAHEREAESANLDGADKEGRYLAATDEAVAATREQSGEDFKSTLPAATIAAAKAKAHNSEMNSQLSTAQAAPEGRNRFSTGFYTAILLSVAALTLYIFAPQISAKVPQFEQGLSSYSNSIDGLRGRLAGVINTK